MHRASVESRQVESLLGQHFKAKDVLEGMLSDLDDNNLFTKKSIILQHLQKERNQLDQFQKTVQELIEQNNYLDTENFNLQKAIKETKRNKNKCKRDKLRLQVKICRRKCTVDSYNSSKLNQLSKDFECHKSVSTEKFNETIKTFKRSVANHLR
jgi:regulator of replication initiation timing